MSNGKLILIVDDDRAIVKGLELRLKMSGYEAIAAHDAQSAIEMATARVPDVVLLDLQLGHEDGLSVLSALRQSDETKHVPVVLISGRKGNVDDARVSAATAILAKPFSGADVVALVNQLTDANCPVN